MSVFQKKLSALLFFAVCCLTMHAQTNVSGFISANTTWDLAGSPYIITGNALLSLGYTLIIEPGVVVRFDEEKALQFDGELIAIGTPQNRITFTSNQSNPAPGDWAKLHFPDTCVNAVFDTSGNYVSGTIMKYCDVLYAGGLGFGAIHIEASSPYFNNCRILYSGSSGIYANYSYFWIDSSSIKDCAERGIHHQYYELAQKDICVRYDTIANNGWDGIYLGYNPGGNPYHFIVTNCYFSNNQGAILASWGRNMVIEENTFIGNYGYYVVGGSGFENMSIRCNNFLENSARVLYLENFPCYGNISYNIFDSNNSGNEDDLIFIQNTYIVIPTIFENNLIRNNTSPVSCMHLIPQMDDNQVTQILNNEFSDNTTQSVILIDPYSQPPGDQDFIVLKHNNFLDQNAEYELYNLVPYGSSNVYVDSNYWGSIIQSHIDSVIYDYFDYANMSVVYYMPFLTTTNFVYPWCAQIATGLTASDKPETFFEAFPNPASSHLTISFNQRIIKGAIIIYNLLGQEVFERSISNSIKEEIEVDKFSPGIYIINVTDGKQSSARKFVIGD